RCSEGPGPSRRSSAGRLGERLGVREASTWQPPSAAVSGGSGLTCVERHTARGGAPWSGRDIWVGAGVYAGLAPTRSVDAIKTWLTGHPFSAPPTLPHG